MASDNLSAVLYKQNDLRLVSFFHRLFPGSCVYRVYRLVHGRHSAMEILKQFCTLISLFLI